MFEISETTMAAFSKEARARFINRAVAHARMLDPQGFGQLAAAAQHDAVATTIDICEEFGITGEAATIFMLEARCALGPSFPRALEHGWASVMLEAERVDEFAAMEYLRDTAFEKARSRHG